MSSMSSSESSTKKKDKERKETKKEKKEKSKKKDSKNLEKGAETVAFECDQNEIAKPKKTFGSLRFKNKKRKKDSLGGDSVDFNGSGGAGGSIKSSASDMTDPSEKIDLDVQKKSAKFKMQERKAGCDQEDNGVDSSEKTKDAAFSESSHSFDDSQNPSSKPQTDKRKPLLKEEGTPAEDHPQGKQEKGKAVNAGAHDKHDQHGNLTKKDQTQMQENGNIKEPKLGKPLKPSSNNEDVSKQNRKPFTKKMRAARRLFWCCCGSY